MLFHKPVKSKIHPSTSTIEAFVGNAAGEGSTVTADVEARLLKGVELGGEATAVVVERVQLR